jgi:uracil-DNA glycosylase family protein
MHEMGAIGVPRQVAFLSYASLPMARRTQRPDDRGTRAPAASPAGTVPAPAPRARVRRLTAVAAEAKGCTRCDLYKLGTQTVFGAGDVRARLMLVGEQPGDVEDRAGVPFVGPAGRVLDEALDAAGLAGVPRYVTNAVKHFKWEPRGKRRIHKKPSVAEMRACHVWLEEEIAAVAPDLIVALGATAARAIAGPAVQVLRDRGQRITMPDGRQVVITVHPSSILRTTSSDERREAMAAFVADLAQVARWLREEQSRRDRS